MHVKKDGVKILISAHLVCSVLLQVGVELERDADLDIEGGTDCERGGGGRG